MSVNPVQRERKGWTLKNARDICLGLGLEFAYCLDGGQSVATIVNQELLTLNTPIYFVDANGNIPANRVNGRTIPSFIVFNGSSTYSVPPAPV